MPEQPESALDAITRDAADHAMPADAGTVDFAAVTSGPETARRRRHGLRVGTWVAGAWMVFVIGGAILAPWLPLDDPQNSVTDLARKGPFAKAGTAPGHLLGGDLNGRDMLSRLLWGGRTTLVIATAAVLIGFVIGGLLGLLAGYFRGRTDTILAGLFDVFLSVPAVILALALVTILRTQPSASGRSSAGLDPEVALIIALGIVSIPVLGRITRASTMSWSEREFVVAARAQGARHLRVVFREVLPNVLPAMLSIALLGIADRHRRRGHAQHPRCERAGRPTDLGQHDRERPPGDRDRALRGVRARTDDLLHRARAELPRRRDPRALRRPRGRAVSEQPAAPLLEVADVATGFETLRGLVRAVDGVSFTVERGQDARHRGRVGLGQDRAVPLDHGPAPPRDVIAQRHRPLRRPRADGHGPTTSCARCWGAELS